MRSTGISQRLSLKDFVTKRKYSKLNFTVIIVTKIALGSAEETQDFEFGHFKNIRNDL